MIVKDLKSKLEGLDDSLPIIISIDQEGNGFREVDYIGVESYEKEDHEIILGIPELTEELEQQGYSEEDVRSLKCVLIV